MRRALIVFAAVLGLSSALLVRAPAPAVSAQTAIASVVVEGTGNGHGRGMSQWGAYGWAVDRGWTWTQILDHYYGNTALGDVDTSGTIDVQLKALDGMTTAGVGVVSYVDAGVQWTGKDPAKVYASMYAAEVAENSFQVYGASTRACPAVRTLTVPDGPIGQGSSDKAGATQIQIFLNTFQPPSDLVVDGLFGNQTGTRLAEWQTAQGLPSDRLWNSDDAERARLLISTGAPTALWEPIGVPVAGPIEFTADNGAVDGATFMTTGAATSALGACDRNGRVTHYRGTIRVDGVSNRVINRCSHRGLPARRRPQGDLCELGRCRWRQRPPGGQGSGGGCQVVCAATRSLGQRHLRHPELPGVFRSRVASIGRKHGSRRRGRPNRQGHSGNRRQGSTVGRRHCRCGEGRRHRVDRVLGIERATHCGLAVPGGRRCAR